MNKEKELWLNILAERIYKHQRAIDKLINEIYLENETFGEQVSEVLRENLYN